MKQIVWMSSAFLVISTSAFAADEEYSVAPVQVDQSSTRPLTTPDTFPEYTTGPITPENSPDIYPRQVITPVIVPPAATKPVIVPPVSGYTTSVPLNSPLSPIGGGVSPMDGRLSPIGDTIKSGL